jgi:hypothetical protein
VSFLWNIILIKTVPAFKRRMSCLEAHLANGAPIAVMGCNRSGGKIPAWLVLLVVA